MSKEMLTDELYCFLFESQDHQSREMWNSIWLGKGTRRVYQVSMSVQTLQNSICIKVTDKLENRSTCSSHFDCRDR